MEQVALFPVPEAEPEEAPLSTVRVQFRDGTKITARNVVETWDDDEWFQIDQADGDFIRVPISSNIQYVEVSFNA